MMTDQEKAQAVAKAWELPDPFCVDCDSSLSDFYLCWRRYGTRQCYCTMCGTWWDRETPGEYYVVSSSTFNMLRDHD